MEGDFLMDAKTILALLVFIGATGYFVFGGGTYETRTFALIFFVVGLIVLLKGIYNNYKNSGRYVV